MKPVWVEFNGRVMPLAETVIPVTDLGFLYGIGVFETLRAYHAKIFRWEAHRTRLMSSAKKLNWGFSPDLLPDEDRLVRLLRANGLSDARLRLSVTAGTPSGSSEPVEPQVLLTAGAVQPYPSEYYEKGITTAVCNSVQVSTDPLAGHKTSCYWPRLAALDEAHAKGCQESLWFTEKRELAEGCISNVFIVKGGMVRTPELATPVLPGITRSVVLELCRAGRIAHEETKLVIDDLLDADEVFLTNCMMEVVPVRRVEGKAIGTEKPGPMTHRLLKEYRRLISRECGALGGAATN